MDLDNKGDSEMETVSTNVSETTKRKHIDKEEEEPPDKKICGEVLPSENLNKNGSECQISKSDECEMSEETGNGHGQDGNPSKDSNEICAIESSAEEQKKAAANCEKSSNETLEENVNNEEPIQNSSSGTNNKKLQWNCGEHFSDQSNDENPSEQCQNPSDTTSSSTAAAADQQLSSTSNPTGRIRDHCKYGSMCYRINPEHKAQYSHPEDPDYNLPDQRPECQYGIRCYRKNPQHRNDFKHTLNVPRRAQTPSRPQSDDNSDREDEDSYEESVDESEYEPSFIDDESVHDEMSDYEDGNEL